MTNDPVVALRMPISSRKSVVLPAPLGPSSPQICPAGTAKEISCSATFSPKVLLTLSTTTRASPVATSGKIGPLAPRQERGPVASSRRDPHAMPTSKPRPPGARAIRAPFLRVSGPFALSVDQQVKLTHAEISRIVSQLCTAWPLRARWINRICQRHGIFAQARLPWLCGWRHPCQNWLPQPLVWATRFRPTPS